MNDRRRWFTAGLATAAVAAAGGVAWRRWLMRPSDDDPQALWAMRFAKPVFPADGS